MAITRTQIAKQLLAQGGRTGFQGGGADMGDPGRAQERADRGYGDTSGPQDKGSPEQNRNQRAQVRAGNVRAIENLIDRPKFGFTDAAKTNLLSPSNLAKTAFGALIGVPGLNFLSNINVNPNPTDDEDDDDDDTGNGNGNNYIPPLMAQAPSNMDQEPEPEIEEEEPFEFYRRFRAEGGIMNTDVVGGEMDFDSARQMYGLGKLVKKVTRSVKKIAKSPIGKAALLYTGVGGLGSIAGGGTFFGNFASPIAQMQGVGNIFSRQGLGRIASKVGLGKMQTFVDPGSPAFQKFVPNMLGKALTSPAGIIAGTSLIAGALTSEQEEEAQQISDETGIDIAEIRANPNKYLARRFRAEGGSMDEPVAKKTMPLLDMDGKEMDLRAEGGFVPIGRMEKADDVPARLSKNEFVFTADAVRNAGDGSVDKGAEVMYNMMKNLESGGDVSEESQGLEGARKMFQTSQRLEEVL